MFLSDCRPALTDQISVESVQIARFSQSLIWSERSKRTSQRHLYHFIDNSACRLNQMPLTYAGKADTLSVLRTPSGLSDQESCYCRKRRIISDAFTPSKQKPGKSIFDMAGVFPMQGPIQFPIEDLPEKKCTAGHARHKLRTFQKADTFDKRSKLT